MKASVFEANSVRGIRKTEEVENVGIIQILLLRPDLPLKGVIAGCRFFLSCCTTVALSALEEYLCSVFLKRTAPYVLLL